MAVSEPKMTIPHMILDTAAAHADRIAIRGEDGQTVAYDDLPLLVGDSARAFIAAGVSAGDRVAIWAPNSVEWIIAAIGAQAAGAAIA